MKISFALRAAAGLLLLATGIFLVRRDPPPPTVETFRSPGCVLSVRTFEPSSQPARGAVFLLHGLAANSRLMDYDSRGFLSLGLRVIAPDLPGHGHSPAPFSPAHAESCAQALLQEKIRTGAIDPGHSILAGHSLGGAIALRLASTHHVAGVLALSPAPLFQAPGVEQEILFFPVLSQPPPHSLFLSAQFDPIALRNSAAALAAAHSSPPADLLVVPASTHASLIFDASALRLSLDWTARLLSLPLPPALPSAPAILGSNLGLLGLLLLAGILLKLALRSFLSDPLAPALPPLSYSRFYLSIALASSLAVLLLTFGVPLRFLNIFTADYLASFSLLTAILFFAANPSSARALFRFPTRPFALALTLGLATTFLFFLWFRFSFTTTWLDLPRLCRLLPLSLALFPFLALEESLLHSARRRSYALRLAESLAVRLLAWLALAFAVYHLHSAQVLLVLMAPFFVFFSIFQRLAIDLFRRQSSSPAAAAFFGAILAAGFLVLILPLT
jgi:pimeloyl-ACP methyl ester carboxylesterase